MRNLIKNLALLLFSAGIVFTALGILVQNYMQNRKFIEKISQSFSKSIHGELSIDSASINLLRGFSLNKITVQSPDSPPAPFLEIQHAILTYNPLSLFLKKLELSSIRLENPHLTFSQSPDGTWWIPNTRARSLPEVDTGPLSFEVLLKNLSLTGGSVTVCRKDGSIILNANPIRIEGKLQSSEIGTRASGHLRIGETRMGNHFSITHMDSSISYMDEVLSIPSLTGSAYGGTASGSIQIDLRIGGPEFLIALNLEKLELTRLIPDLGGDSQWLQGKLSTLCRVKGRFESPELLHGSGTMEISDGTMSGFSFLKELNQLFPNHHFPETKFNTITGNYKIAGKKLTIYNLEAISKDVQLTGTGTVSLNRELDMDMRLSLSPDFTALLSPGKAARFTRRDDGFSTITFTVSGTLEKPETNLPEKMTPPAPALPAPASPPSPRTPEAQATALLNPT